MMQTRPLRKRLPSTAVAPVQKRPLRRQFVLLVCTVVAGLALPLLAEEKRAKPPQFESGKFGNVFYSDLTTAVQPTRPSASQLQGASAQPLMAAAGAQPAGGGAADGGNAGAGWSALASPVSLEDEVKRLKLHFDSVVTTPGPFKSGGYQDARLDLSVLATLFAVIAEYGADVRWKDEAGAARDLLARTAFNAKAGSVQVYNEAKLRKADLQDLVAGSGLANRESSESNDWSMIVDRAPLMEYLEWLYFEELSPHSNNKAAVTEHADSLRRYAEMVALMGEVLVQEGMDEADDEDYKQLSAAMTKAALDVRAALESGDADGVRAAVGAIGQSCDACHEQFR